MQRQHADAHQINRRNQHHCRSCRTAAQYPEKSRACSQQRDRLQIQNHRPQVKADISKPAQPIRSEMLRSRFKHQGFINRSEIRKQIRRNQENRQQQQTNAQQPIPYDPAICFFPHAAPDHHSRNHQAKDPRGIFDADSDPGHDNRQPQPSGLSALQIQLGKQREEQDEESQHNIRRRIGGVFHQNRRKCKDKSGNRLSKRPALFLHHPSGQNRCQGDHRCPKKRRKTSRNHIEGHVMRLKRLIGRNPEQDARRQGKERCIALDFKLVRPIVDKGQPGVSAQHVDCVVHNGKLVGMQRHRVSPETRGQPKSHPAKGDQSQDPERCSFSSVAFCHSSVHLPFSDCCANLCARISSSSKSWRFFRLMVSRTSPEKKD